METTDITIKVTNLKKGWGIRLYNKDGTINSGTFVKFRTEIGPACRDLLRWYDKMGGDSKYAYASRHRAGLKRKVV